MHKKNNELYLNSKIVNLMDVRKIKDNNNCILS